MNLESTFGSSPRSIQTMLSGIAVTFPAGNKAIGLSERKNASKLPARHHRVEAGGGQSYLSYEEIVEHLKKGYSFSPRDADSYLPLAQAHVELGNWEAAIKVCSTAIGLFTEGQHQQRETKACLAHFFRAYAHGSLAQKSEGQQRLEHLKESERDYLEAISLDPKFVSAHCYLGVLYALQSRWDEAEKAFKQAIKLKPDYAEAHNDLGAMYARSGRPRLAAKALERAAELKPRELRVLRNLGEAYWELERWEDAQRVYRKAIRNAPEDAVLRYLLGNAYTAQGQLQKAVPCFTAAIRLDPEYADAYGNLGAVYYKLGRVHDAVEALSQALEIEPDDAAVNQSLREIRYQILEGAARAQLAARGRNAVISFDALAELLTEARAHVFGETDLSNPFDGYAPEEIVSALGPAVKRLKPGSRIELAAKFLEAGLLSSGKAARLAGMGHPEFLKSMERRGLALTPSAGRGTPPIDVEAAVSLLRSWDEGDPKEQKETWDYLRVALDEDRLSNRKLFG